MNEQKIQNYLDGEIVRLRSGYEVRTSHGTGKGATVAEALKDLADKQVKPKTSRKRKSTKRKVGKLQFDVGINPETEMIEPSNLREADESESLTDSK